MESPIVVVALLLSDVPGLGWAPSFSFSLCGLMTAAWACLCMLRANFGAKIMACDSFMMIKTA